MPVACCMLTTGVRYVSDELRSVMNTKSRGSDLFPICGMMHTEVADTVLMNTEVGEVINESTKEYCNEEIFETCIQGAIKWLTKR